MNGENSRFGNVHRPINKNYNPFDPLMDQILYVTSAIILVIKNEIVER
jgi:hypothetical protein